MKRLLVLTFVLSGCTHPTSEWMRAFSPISYETPGERECRMMAVDPSRAAAIWERGVCFIQEPVPAATTENPFNEEVILYSRTACGDRCEVRR
jgi:hypothetical protein